MSEWSAVQSPMIKYAEEIGWQRVTPSDAMAWRGSKREQFFTDVLSAQLQRLNPGIVNTARAEEIIRRLRLLPATIEGNRDALMWLRGQMSVFVAEESRERNVRLLDFETPDANLFHVTWEWQHEREGGVFPNRADVTFLINGIPVAVAELKAAEKPNGAAEGVEQIRRYHRETPEMLTHAQVFEVSQMLDFYYGPTWSASRKNLMNWKDDAPDDAAYEAKVKAFFNRARMLQVLKEYVVFQQKDDTLSKVLLRQHQTRAIEKAVVRAHDPHKRRALIWHTQGSGKTLTMLTLASKLLQSTMDGEKPTVVLLVDRNELESQLFQNVQAYGIGTVRIAENKRDLQDILRSDYRGLVASMIHKFDDVPANLNLRRSIVVLVDEAHRTTGGDLGNYLLAALPNATYIGFTGTPIDKLFRGEGTFKTFGTDDPQGYLDKYSIGESIPDGTTLPLHYALAPSELRIDRERLETQFLNLTEAEGVSDVEELNALLDRAVTLREFMKAADRVTAIARFVADHYTHTVAPMGFKAFLVGVDREACALYKAALDKYLPAEQSCVVISPAQNDTPLLKQHYLDAAAEKQVRRDFLDPEKNPQILIVTEKLLTGFDAPLLYALYLDKPMRDHVLLQTIARVNRPYESKAGQIKPCGLIVDFVGLFERLEKALAFDSETIASVIQNLDVLRGLFETLLREQGQIYLPFARGWSDKDKERAIEQFRDKDARTKFFEFYKKLETVYDILSPDAFLRPHLQDYQALIRLFGLIWQAYNRTYVDKELAAKTRALLQETTHAPDIELPQKIYTLGPEELAAFKQSDSSETVKILNLRKILETTADLEGGAKPFLLGIGARAASLAEAYENRQISTQAALDGLEKAAEEYIAADTEQAALGLNANAYALFTALRPLVPNITAAQAQSVDAVFERFPEYQWDAEQKRQIRAMLYQLIRPLVPPGKMADTTTTLLGMRRI